MNGTKRIERILEARGHWLIFAGMSVWAAFLIAQYLHANLLVLLDKLLVDDAFYYFNIAKHVVMGKGFTIDGLNRTNGFQPLWQLLILPIFAIFNDPIVQVRAVIFLGGLLHLFSGFLLFEIFKRIWSKGWALLITYFWVLNHSILKINLSGMESPIFAVTFLSFVLVLVKYIDQIPRNRIILLLGVMTAFVSLSRVETSIIFFFVSLFLIFELYRKQFPFNKILFSLSIYLIGFSLFFGPYLIWNLFYFKTLLPVSGEAKFFYEFGAGWMPILQPKLFVIQTLGNIKVFVGHMLDLAFGSFNHYLGAYLHQTLGVVVQVNYLKWIYGILLMAAIGIQILRKRNFDIPIPYRSMVLTLALFCFVHFLFISILLPHFATYNTWYYPAILILVISVGILTLRIIFNKMGKFKWIFSFLIIFLVFAQNSLYKNIENETNELPKAVNSSRIRFYEGTQWMNNNLPRGSIIGAFSAGIQGFFSEHIVINLDGFANSKDYLNHLKSKKFKEYIDRNNITYISDYFGYDPLKDGINWEGKLPGKKLKVLGKWPLQENLTYMVLKYEK